jgi:hypothetical protein
VRLHCCRHAPARMTRTIVGRGANAAVLSVPVSAIPITSRRDMRIGILCAPIGVGMAYFSSATARVIASLRPKPGKEVAETVNERAFCFARWRGRCTMGHGSRCGVNEDTPRAIWVSVKIQERARNRLTGIRTRGSPEPFRPRDSYGTYMCSVQGAPKQSCYRTMVGIPEKRLSIRLESAHGPALSEHAPCIPSSSPSIRLLCCLPERT